MELAAGERQAASVAIIEGRVDVKPNCPHCGSEHVVRNGTRDRPCSTADAIRPVDDKASVIAALGPLLPKDIILCSDGRSTLAAAAKVLGVARRPFNLCRLASAWWPVFITCRT